MDAITIKNLNYAYPNGHYALKDINLNIKKGARFVILGSNGSGKSTLLHHLNGLILPQSGTIEVFNQHINKKNLKAIRKKVGVVFDTPDDQLFATSVYDDIAFGPRNLGLSEPLVNEAVEKALKAVDIVKLKNQSPYALSLGQKKKASIAGVLAMNPDILVFDEPFSGLDHGSIEYLLTIFNELSHKGCTLIITTHNVDLAYSWGNECVLLKDGEILEQGSMHLLEDSQLMTSSHLRTNILATLFEETPFNPRTIDDAKALLKKYMYTERN
ncbi:cobalt/nickel transport system ATP-binding protein [Natranaerovirga hydrolytica]|uniref:Cobalt/nickel transport system ATP-binding protein n=1 Tax=Natranaerovirga hydrolytica TaxID=680378 RepID=A0A4R1MXY8_9FIRM|nr:ATP-binding cassette domain-containing protein [Natranaerovirga hydrolytica]TCK98137.1 cobalt/nickel transport system ATP-binding protein [Natranaerovirga hydrolytica]